MPKVVELTGKKGSAKPESRPESRAGFKNGDTAEIVIFPGVRYERSGKDSLPDPGLVRR